MEREGKAFRSNFVGYCLGESDMREYHPAFVAEMAKAAAALCDPSDNVLKSDEWNDSINQIVVLRACACGWREIQEAGKVTPIGARREARNAVSMARRCANQVDKRADNLCRMFNIPYEYRGGDQVMARSLWEAFRNLYVEVGNSKMCWVLISTRIAKSEETRAAIISQYGVPNEFLYNDELMMDASLGAEAFAALVNSYLRGRANVMGKK